MDNIAKPVDIDVYLSSCTLLNEPDLLRSTFKSGLIARYVAIYRVKKVYIYYSGYTNTCKQHGNLLKTLLEYAKTPPYLKRRLFPKKKELKYAGLIPPLQIPTHVVSTIPVKGEYREGYVVRLGREKIVLDVGLPMLIEVDYYSSEVPREILAKGVTVLTRVEDTNPLVLRIVDPDKERVYTGYSVHLTGSLKSVIEKESEHRYIVATSRKGRPFWRSVGSMLNGLLNFDGKISLFFGEPYRGFYEMIEQDYGGVPEDFFHDIFNFIPDQGTKTIRVEEALPAALQSIRLLEKEYFSKESNLKKSEST